jgi:hypothetical protein
MPGMLDMLMGSGKEDFNRELYDNNRDRRELHKLIEDTRRTRKRARDLRIHSEEGDKWRSIGFRKSPFYDAQHPHHIEQDWTMAPQLAGDPTTRGDNWPRPSLEAHGDYPTLPRDVWEPEMMAVDGKAMPTKDIKSLLQLIRNLTQ